MQYVPFFTSWVASSFSLPCIICVNSWQAVLVHLISHSPHFPSPCVCTHHTAKIRKNQRQFSTLFNLTKRWQGKSSALSAIKSSQKEEPPLSFPSNKVNVLRTRDSKVHIRFVYPALHITQTHLRLMEVRSPVFTLHVLSIQHASNCRI